MKLKRVRQMEKISPDKMENREHIDLKRERVASMKKFHLLNTILILLCFVCCRSTGLIELLSYKKEKHYESSAINDTTSLTLCAQWQLDSLSIVEILQSSEPTDLMTINYICSVLPCVYTGEAIINGKLHKYEINAGGFTYLQNGENESYLLYDKDRKFFLEELWSSDKYNNDIDNDNY